jgi:hypothetical protein
MGFSIRRVLCEFAQWILRQCHSHFNGDSAFNPTPDEHALGSDSSPAHPHFPDVVWSMADDHDAEKEGWAIYEAKGVLEIEAIQDPEHEFAIIQKDDPSALAYVAAKAAAGSERHLRALRIHASFLPHPNEPNLVVHRLAHESHEDLVDYTRTGIMTCLSYARWVTDMLGILFLKHQLTMVPMRDGWDSYPYDNVRAALKSSARVLDSLERQGLEAFSFGSADLKSLLVILETVCNYLASADTVERFLRGPGDSDWAKMMLATIGLINEVCDIGEVYRVTTGTSAVRFATTLDRALVIAHFASDHSTQYPASVYCGAENVATVVAR